MPIVLSESVTSARFGVEASTLAEHISDVLGASALDYELVGVEYDLRSLIEQTLPAGVRIEGESLVADDAVETDVDAVREAVGWVDVHTVALGHDMAGPGS